MKEQEWSFKKVKKTENLLWGIILFILLIMTIIRPRMYNILVLAGCVIGNGIRLFSKKEKTMKQMCLGIVDKVVGIVLLGYFIGSFLDAFFPYRAPHEYRQDIAEFKAEDLQRYYHFPDEIPDSARKIQWICCPGMMQGSGFEGLFFYADHSYIKEVREAYKEQSTIYPHGEYGWMNEETGKTVGFSGYSIPAEERKNTTVYIVYEDEDMDYHWNSGFCINEVEGYIYYFAQ